MSTPMRSACDQPVVSVRQQYAAMSDVNLVLACQRREVKAFEVLIDRYGHYVHGLFYKMAPDWSSCREDLAQEVFIRLWCSIGTLRNPNAFKGWLNRVVKNLFYDEIRRRPAVVIVSMDEPARADDDLGATRDIVDISSAPDEIFQRLEIVEKVQEAMELLPVQFRNAIVLRELQGLPYDEIAAVTRTEVGTVKSRIARARSKMQKQLSALKCA